MKQSDGFYMFSYLTNTPYSHPPRRQQKFFLKYWLLYNFLNVAASILPLNW
jgi:hypothetical protein